MGRSSIIACAAVAVAVLAWPAKGAEQAGVAAGVVGNVTVTGEPRQKPVDARSGMEMLRFDRVVTRPEARMQILLLNKTTFSVGPKSEVVIDEFVYDPDKGVVDMAAEFVKGVFRYVAGSADKVQSREVEIETAAGVIGVRGTSVFLHRDGEDGGIFAGLLGPGSGNNAKMRRGGFVVRNDQGRTRVLRSGFGVRLEPGEPPGEPVRIPQRLMARVQGGLQGTPASPPAPGVERAAAPAGLRDAEVVAGQSRAVARTAAMKAKERGQADSALDQVRSEGAVEINRQTEVVEMDGGDMRGITNVFGNLDVGLDNTTFAALSWTDAENLNLHVTGPQTNSEERFHVFGEQQRGALTEAPFAQIVQAEQGAEGVDAAAITQLVQGGPYRISAFNAGNPALEGTALANQSGAMMTLLRAGALSRGPGGTVEVNQDLLRVLTPPEDGVGNTWVGAEFNGGDGTIEVINEMTSFSSESAVQ